MASIQKKSITTFQSRVAQMEAGFEKNIPVTSSLTVDTASMTQPQIIAKLQAIEALATTVTSAKAAYAVQVAAQKAALPAAKQFMTSLVAVLKQQLGTQNPELPSFGISLPKPKAAKTAAQKAISAAKSAATRAARGTKGSKQKALITTAGTPGIVVVSPTGEALQTLGPVPPGGSAPVSVPLAALNAVGGGAAPGTSSSGSGK